MSKSREKKNSDRLTRRKFVRTSGAALAGLAAAATGADALAAVSQTTADSQTRRLAMVIDLDRCTNCRACAVACKAENGVRLGGFRSWVSEQEYGRYPVVTRYYLPRLCNHCQEPACLKVCPVGATYKRPDGVVAVDKSRCIGCRYCMVACPYGARYFNPRKDSESAQMFPARTPGTIDKCDFCAHRVDNGVVPSCVNTCPVSARLFGDLNDTDSEVYRKYAGERPAPLLPEFGTGPFVFYKGGNLQVFAKEKS